MAKLNGSHECPHEWCSRVFDKKCNFQRHMKICPKEKPFVCIFCKEVLPNKRAQTRHQRKHLPKPKLPCTNCGKIYRREDHLLRHKSTCSHPPLQLPEPLLADYSDEEDSDNSRVDGLEFLDHIKKCTCDLKVKCTCVDEK